MSNIDPTFPLVELHRHLEGAVRLETVLELGLQHNLPLPAKTLEGLRPHVELSEPKPGLMEFLAKLEWEVGILVDYDACRRIAYESIEQSQIEGLDYVELRFSPWFMSLPHGLNPAGVVEAVVDGVQAGSRDYGLPASLIGILSRTFGVDACHKELDALLTQKDHITCLDLAGDEAGFPAKLFIDHFQKAKSAGWELMAHAGESDGAHSVWDALNLLGATRIGHAAQARQDPKLLDYLAENEIGVEVSLTSNVQTSVVADYATHPIKQMLEHGIKVCLNTDDPVISAIDIAYEYNVAAPAAGLSKAQIHQTQRNAFDISFLTTEQRETLVAAKK